MPRFFDTFSTSLRNFFKAAMFLFASLGLGSCTVIPLVAYVHIVPDTKDMHRFKHAAVRHSDNCYEFKKATSNKTIWVSNYTHKLPVVKSSLEQFLEQQEANYVLVIKNDSLMFEYTNPKIKEYELVPSFSLAKAFVSATLGVAIKEGFIGSVKDPVIKYLPELDYHANFKLLTIEHLMNQKSGLKMEVDNISIAYYGQVEKMLKAMHFKAKPGEHFEYININTILVGLIIERTTKRDLHEYFSDKIWSKIGTCDSTVWGYDYKSKHTRSFSCFGGSPRDYAKFGQLYLNKGKWFDQQIIDSNWINSSTSRINSLGEDVGYNNYWYIGEKEIGDYCAVGMYRQQIYIHPKKNVVVVTFVKFNKKNLPLRWWQILRQIADQV